MTFTVERYLTIQNPLSFKTSVDKGAGELVKYNMEEKDLQSKLEKLREDRQTFAIKAQEDINRKQQELQALVKAAQKRIDQMEGAELAYQDLLPKPQPEPQPEKETPTKNEKPN
jgi:seryl-tRNA synthetase